VIASRAQAVVNALRSTTYAVGMCARWTREQFGIQALGDFDGDGDADAVDMWKACKLKHPGDRNPPAGVPVFWSGGSSGHGHAAVAFAGQRCRTIDRPAPGRVSTVPLSEIERAWGLTYLGWSADLYGHVIPAVAPDPPKKTGPSVAAVNKAIRVAVRDKVGGRIVARLKKLRRDLRAKKKGTNR
jgi:hypothetical protein